jgi:MarR family 2-MHQ and catechol resistance regulon transcriptional repressor
MTTIAPAAARPTSTGHEAAVLVLVEQLERTLGALRCTGSQRLLRMGISMTHLHVLRLLRYHGAMPMGRIAELLDGTMSSATGIVDRMEERGLIERSRTPEDRRVVIVRTSEAGERLIEEVELGRTDLMAAVLGRLDDAQLDRLAGSIGDVRAAAVMELQSDPERYADLLAHLHPSGGTAPPDPASAAPAAIRRSPG